MDWKDRIAIDPNVQGGNPVIRGTRTPVTCVLGELAGGMSFADIQREYDLTGEDIRAAILFAQESVGQKQRRAIPA